MNILYSFNKKGYEADCWERGICAASDDTITFIPFNHQFYLNPRRYINAIALDKLYQDKHKDLMQMYEEFEAAIHKFHIDAIIVDNCPPYHPEFLKKLQVYKVLYSGDDPGATYMRNIPYLHAYDHVFYLNPDYSRDMNMSQKMRYCGMANENWIPHGFFDEDCDSGNDESEILQHERDIDIIYVGAPYRQKLSLLSKVKKTFGARCRIYGRFRPEWNIYYNLRYGWPGWIRPVSFPRRTQLHQRAKIGFNIHWNEYGLGNQRLYYLPANGVMQICDSQKYLGRVFEVDKEVVAYRGVKELIEKIRYYLEHENERQEIARNGYLRVMKDYRFSDILRKSGYVIQKQISSCKNRR
jgi:spore maturation protein CgeB